MYAKKQAQALPRVKLERVETFSPLISSRLWICEEVDHLTIKRRTRLSFLADPENRLSAKSTKVAICITVATLVERELQEVAQQGSRLVRLTMISTPSLQNNSISSSGTLESKFRSLYLASQDVMFVIY